MNQKLYFIIHLNFRKMAEEFQTDTQSCVSSVSYLGKPFNGYEWKQLVMRWETHVCRTLGARITSVRRDTQNNFYITSPAESPPTFKPTYYFEIGKDIGLKILALEHMP